MARKKRKTENNNNAVIFFAENFITVHNEHNFTALMNAMDECLRRYIKSIVKDDYATSDVLSRVMEIVYYKTGDFEDRPRSLLKWIYLIAFRTSVSYLRGELDAEGKYKHPDVLDKISYRSTLSDESECLMGDEDEFDIYFDGNEYIRYDESSLKGELCDFLINDIKNMEGNLSKIVSLRYIDGKKLIVISEELGLPLHKIKDDIRKGKNLLRNELVKNLPVQCKIYNENLIRC